MEIVNINEFLSVTIAQKALVTLNPKGCTDPALAGDEPDFSFRPLGFKLSNGYTLSVQLIREHDANTQPIHEVCLTCTDGGKFIFALTGRGYNDIRAIKETVSSVLDNVPDGGLRNDCTIEDVAFTEPLCRYLLVQYNGSSVAQEVFTLYEKAAEKMREQFAAAAVAAKLLSESDADGLKMFGPLEYQMLTLEGDGRYGINRFRAFAGTTWWTIFCLPVEQTSGTLTVGPYADAAKNGQSEGAFVPELLKKKEEEKKDAISTILTLAPEHISGETAAMLDENGETGALPVTVYNKDVFGWYVYFSAEMLANNHIPDDLAACIQYAQARGCDAICFDNCEGTIDALPTYDWDECERAPQLE